MPVEKPRFELEAQIGVGIVANKAKSRVIVVGSGDLCPASERDYTRKPQATAELDDASACQVLLYDTACQRHSTRPELSPVRKTLVASEVLLVDQGVRRRRVRDTVRSFSDLDEGFDQPGTALKKRLEARPGFLQSMLERYVYVVEVTALSVRASASSTSLAPLAWAARLSRSSAAI